MTINIFNRIAKYQVKYFITNRKRCLNILIYLLYLFKVCETLIIFLFENDSNNTL